MPKRLFTAFLAIVAGCGGRNDPPQRLPVASAPEQTVSRLPVEEGKASKYPGKCGCGCGAYSCLYGNCGKGGIPKCCDKCKCVQESSSLEEINKSSSELLDKLKEEAPPPSSPGKSDSEAQPPKEVLEETPVSLAPRREWYRVQGRPGLWAYGVLSEKKEIVDITHWYQESHNHQR